AVRTCSRHAGCTSASVTQHDSGLMLLRRVGLACALLLSVASRMSAQLDTISRGAMFTWRDAAILEGFAIATVAIAPLDTRVAKRLRDPYLQDNRKLRRTAEFVRTVAEPGAAVIGVGMYAYGRIAKDAKAADLGLHGSE